MATAFGGFDFWNPAVQFAVLPLWTKAVHQQYRKVGIRHTIILYLFSYDPALFMDGATGSYSFPEFGELESPDMSKLWAFGRLAVPQKPTAKMHDFFKINPVLRNAWAYYSTMPARYYQSSHNPRAKPFPYGLQRIPKHVDVEKIFRLEFEAKSNTASSEASPQRTASNSPSLETEIFHGRSGRLPGRLVMNSSQTARNIEQSPTAFLNPPKNNKKFSVVEIISGNSTIRVGAMKADESWAEFRGLVYKDRMAQPSWRSLLNNLEMVGFK